MSIKILEFIRTLEKWDQANSMLYNSIETEDNPLISFIASEKGWIIKSPWQLFECNEIIPKGEILESIKILAESVKEPDLRHAIGQESKCFTPCGKKRISYFQPLVKFSI
ncbi:MAG: hypothetical protein K0R19_160 [Bacillota bacterium]|jgi:hypothetical protein|nr:hypothetical protein [Bacillota bacterium]